MNKEIVIAVTILAGCRFVQAAGPVQVAIESLGNNQYKMNFQMDVQASSSAVWGVLTDYDHHADYLPHLTRSQLIFKNWDYAVVDQEGKVKFLFWTFTLWVRQKINEKPMTAVLFQATEGDFSQLKGTWTLSGPAPGRTHLACELTMQPRRRVPGWAVRWSAKKYLGAMVEALARHAERRF